MPKIFILCDCNKLCINRGYLRKYGGREKIYQCFPWEPSRGHGLPLDPRIWGVVGTLSDAVRQFVQKRDFDETKQERRKASVP